MTPTEDQPSISTETATQKVDRATMAQTALAPLTALAGRALGGLGRHRDEAVLMLAAGVYLAITFGLLLGQFGILAGIAGAALIWRFGRSVPANTLLTLYRAQPIAPKQGAALRAALSTLAARASLPHEPAIAIVPSLAPGVFSSGHGDRIAILMTEGLLRRYSLPEIVAIAAHEIAHMKAGDLTYFSLTDSLTRVAQVLAYLGVALFFVEASATLIGESIGWWIAILLLILAPAFNSLLQLALPRQREYTADETAATLLGDRAVLAEVARSMESDTGQPLDDLRFPVPQRRAPIPSPGRAHISGAERAARLAAAPLAATQQPRLIVTDEPLVSLVGVGPIEMRPRNRWPGLWF